MNWWYINL